MSSAHVDFECTLLHVVRREEDLQQLHMRSKGVRYATHLRKSKMSSISCLVAQLTVTLDKRMLVFFSRPFLSQTFSLTLIEMHVVVFSESVIHLQKSIVFTECF